MTRLRRRPAMGTALLALGLAATATAWACTPDHTGTLSVSPTSASPGEAVTVTASGLKLANAPYDVLYLDPALPKGVVVPTCSVAGQPMITEPKVVLSSASAGFTASATIPPVTTAGAASICVTLARYSGPPEALIDITVVGGQPPPPPLAFAADDHPPEGTSTESPEGGIFEREVKSKAGYHRHHMPAKSVTGRPENCTPAIRMVDVHHRKTKSFGGGPAAVHRAQQKALIEAGRFRDAMQMDIDDVRANFGSKYDAAIELALESLDRMC